MALLAYEGAKLAHKIAKDSGAGKWAADKLLGQKGWARQAVRDTLGFTPEAGGPGRKFKTGAGAGKRRRQGRRKSVAVHGGPNPGDGGVVNSANAPVAFARRGEIKPFFSIKPGETPDEIVVHGIDFVATMTPGASANTFGLMNDTQFSPGQTGLTFLNKEGQLYEKWKPKLLKLHYVHFCPTSTQCKVMLTVDSNAVETTIPTTSAQMVSLNGCVVGAAYEDFSYTYNPALWQQDWYQIGSTTTGAAGELDSACQFMVAADNQSSTLPAVGDLYAEYVVKLGSRRLTAVPALDLAKALTRALHLITPTERKTKYFQLLTEFWEKDLQDRKAKEAKIQGKKDEEERQIKAADEMFSRYLQVKEAEPADFEIVEVAQATNTLGIRAKALALPVKR